jgi:hypothetical protein
VALGLVFVGVGIRVRLETRGLKVWNLIAILICVIGAVGLLLAVLHGIECGIWAVAYLWLGALDSPMDALLFSLDSMSTLGASGLTLQRPWQMMGALEAVDGMKKSFIRRGIRAVTARCLVFVALGAATRI